MAQPQAAVGIHAAAAALLALNAAVLSIINARVPDSYMDEPFHVGQTQKYCRGLFSEWDPKITTFPGLYVLGTAAGWLHYGAKQALGQQVLMEAACSTPTLRAVNTLLAVACLYTLHAVIAALRQPSQARGSTRSQHKQGQQGSSTSSVLWALALSVLPLHWSYSYLYYTDVGSTLLMLLCYLACLRHRPLAAAAAAAGAVLFRQTNAVWVVFVMGATVLRMVQRARSEAAKSGRQAAGEQDSLWSELRATVVYKWRIRGQLAWAVGPMALVPAAFIAFLVVNGGVTVGDREAHKPVKHWAQLVYFAPYAAAMLAAQLAPCVWGAVRVAARRPLLALVALAALCAAAVAAQRASPPAHPYLLADNRHYTFYIWRKLIDRPGRWRQAVVAPASAAAWAVLLSGLRSTQQRLWVLGWAVCTVAVLVPAWLLEFRYYTLPLVMAALHLPHPTKGQSATTLFLFAAMNAATLYMFVMRPFSWADGSVARFMW
uniref:Dol-P-Glc:Glc(2)Man(9)GlcNAc(2)-PP-Dol alpha-1,2-glucosyltransferase n=1 Tax=Chlamydomonas leiostraca TaxID=1034604 RepID=A0A7S0S2Y7_9CHLO|mmetsp:Transcript_37354/g.94222  ORF Transcript_37354/g.94222 Transcript_37354/m.94222 type:complete len:488 (+) Transcript_37354:65-1528(+)